MSEIIYTKINPKDYIEDIGLTISNINETLIESIKKEGIKFPILGFCNNKIIKFIVGAQRIFIAFKLGLTEVPAILYSYDKRCEREYAPDNFPAAVLLGTSAVGEWSVLPLLGLMADVSRALPRKKYSF